MAASYIVPRPSGFEVEVEIVASTNVTMTTSPTPELENCRERKKTAATSCSRKLFRYTGQKPTKAMHHNRNSYARVVISSDVVKIPEEAFYNWEALEEIIFEPPSQCKEIQQNAFFGCRRLSRLSAGCLPESMEVIGSHAFACCDGLETIHIPSGVLSIQDMAFFGCDRLTSLQLPSSLREIQHNAFRGCTALSRVIVPPSVCTIGSAVFAECKSLRHVTLPFDLERIEPSLFSQCSSLRAIDHHGEKEEIHVVNDFEDDNEKVAKSNVQLPPSLVSIGEEAFFKCKQLTLLNVPSTCRRIGAHAFESCTLLQQISLSAATQYVGEGCFRNCSSLHTVKLPLEIAFGRAAFDGCTNLKALVDVLTDEIIWL